MTEERVCYRREGRGKKRKGEERRMDRGRSRLQGRLIFPSFGSSVGDHGEGNEEGRRNDASDITRAIMIILGGGIDYAG